ncbi:MAG: glycosyltransferase family 9 protein [Pelagibacterales bacterium]|nr:glycosyltransferase family 9 protein [Pelagibacterales bacterium]
MGDVAMTVPIIRLVKRRSPSTKISILTKPSYIEIFREFKEANIISIDLKGKHKGLFGLVKLYYELKQLGVDVVIDLHGVLRTNFLKLLWGKNFYQIEKGRKEKENLINGKHFQQLKTTHQRYLDVFNNINYNLSFSKIEFPKKSNLSRHAITSKIDFSKKLIGIAPFAKHKAKAYSLEQMKEVIGSISKEYTVLLFGGGENESKQLKTISKENKKVFSLAEEFSLSDQLDFISNLDLMISMDSANGHLAAMYGVKVLTIWGVTHPYTGFAPFNQSSKYSILVDKNTYPKIPTSIYGNKYPKGYEKAINSISAEEIVKKVEEIS